MALAIRSITKQGSTLEQPYEIFFLELEQNFKELLSICL